MPPRFHLPPADLHAGTVTLAGSEAHHLAHVLRLGEGEGVELFDGAGHAAAATVAGVRGKAAKTVVSLAVDGEPRFRPNVPAVRVTLAVAPPKGDRFRSLVEKATELGVAEIVPLLTARGTVTPRDAKLDKLRQTALAACKQCGRNVLPVILDPTPFADLLRTTFDGRTVLLDPGGKPAGFGEGRTDVAVRLLVGPEGGFGEGELRAAADAGVASVRLPTPMLRVETAAVAGVSLAVCGGLS